MFHPYSQKLHANKDHPQASHNTATTAPATAASIPAALPAKASTPLVLVGVSAEKVTELVGTSVGLGASEEVVILGATVEETLPLVVVA